MTTQYLDLNHQRNRRQDRPPSQDFPRPMKLSDCHGKNVAIVVSLQGREQVLRAQGRYERDENDSGALRLELADDQSETSGRPVLILDERQQQSEIALDNQYGCDVCIKLKGN